MPDAASASNGADPDGSRHRHRAQAETEKPEQSASCQPTSSGVLGEFFFRLPFRTYETNKLEETAQMEAKGERLGQVDVTGGRHEPPGTMRVCFCLGV